MPPKYMFCGFPQRFIVVWGYLVRSVCDMLYLCTHNICQHVETTMRYIFCEPLILYLVQPRKLMEEAPTTVLNGRETNDDRKPHLHQIRQPYTEGDRKYHLVSTCPWSIVEEAGRIVVADWPYRPQC